MVDDFVREQRGEVRKLKSLINMAEGGKKEQFDLTVKSFLKDNVLSKKVEHLKETAKDLYRKELEVRAFNEEFVERPEVGVENRWNVTSTAKVPDWIVRGGWNDQEFFKKYVAKVLTLEVEQKEKNILSLERQNLGIAR